MSTQVIEIQATFLRFNPSLPAEARKIAEFKRGEIEGGIYEAGDRLYFKSATGVTEISLRQVVEAVIFMGGDVVIKPASKTEKAPTYEDVADKVSMGILLALNEEGDNYLWVETCRVDSYDYANKTIQVSLEFQTGFADKQQIFSKSTWLDLANRQIKAAGYRTGNMRLVRETYDSEAEARMIEIEGIIHLG